MQKTEDPFTEQWTTAERTEYAALTIARTDQAASAVIPSLVRETLHAMREETPEDEDLTRALKAVEP